VLGWIEDSGLEMYLVLKPIIDPTISSFEHIQIEMREQVKATHEDMTMKLGKKRQRTKLGLPLSANYKNM
jgi:hypothetical protein